MGGSYSLLVFYLFVSSSLKLAGFAFQFRKIQTQNPKAWGMRTLDDDKPRKCFVWPNIRAPTAALLVQINSKLNKAVVVERK